MTAWILRQRLGPPKGPVSTGDGLSDLTADICGFIGRPSEQKESEWAWSRWTPKSLKRWLASRAYRDAQLSWPGCKLTQPVPGHRVTTGLGDRLGSGRGLGLLPRRARLDGPHRLGTTRLSFLLRLEQLLRRICVVGAPSRLLGLRVLVAELVWEANTGAGT